MASGRPLSLRSPADSRLVLLAGLAVLLVALCCIPATQAGKQDYGKQGNSKEQFKNKYSAKANSRPLDGEATDEIAGGQPKYDKYANGKPEKYDKYAHKNGGGEFGKHKHQQQQAVDEAARSADNEIDAVGVDADERQYGKQEKYDKHASGGKHGEKYDKLYAGKEARYQQQKADKYVKKHKQQQRNDGLDSADAVQTDVATADDGGAAADEEESNDIPAERYDPDFRRLHKPFRMSKLNLVWSKAQQRLTEPKLKSLFTDLKIQDKEELAWKQLNGQHMDKDGLKEAAMRQKLIGIMSTYDILEHFDDTQDPEKYRRHKQQHQTQAGRDDSHKNRSLFKDKKLNKLWERAEVSGFTADELAALREEFVHHQDKVDVYYSVLEQNVERRKAERHENAVNDDEFDQINQIQHAEEDVGVVPDAAAKRNAFVDEANLLRDKHRELRDNFDRLERISAKAPNSQEFVEPKVQSLWRVASAGNFSADELASVRVELLHFEARLLKLRHLHAEQALNLEKYKEGEAVHQVKHDRYASMDQHIKKQLRKVETMQTLLEERIYAHSEL